MEGVKYDKDKPRWDLVPWVEFGAVVEVLTYGAKKYGERNWEKGISRGRLIAAAFRHIVSYTGGKMYDEETALPHLAHAICCLLFALTLDDRENDPT